MHKLRRWVGRMGLAVLLAGLSAPAWATLAGLIQISTPDIQPIGELSSTYQVQHRVIGPTHQLQFEVGLTPSFAIAVYQGISPPQTVTNAELNLFHRDSLYVSLGYLGTEDANTYQPFIQTGYHTKEDDLVVGIQRQHSANYAIMGFGHQIVPRVTVQADYISGAGVSNFLAAGVVYDITPELSVNPAIFVRNRDRHAFGFFSITWEAKVW